MKKLLCLIMLLALVGCGPSLNQLIGEQEYYKARVALAKQMSSQPIFEMIPAKPGEPIVLGNVGSFKVFMPVANSGENLKQYLHTDYAQKWVGLIGTTVSIAAPWLGAWGIVHEVSKIAGPSTTYNQSVTGTNNSAVTKTSSIQAGNMGDGNSLTGMSETSDSYNTTTTTTTTSTDDHSTPAEE